jgi:hypothetical protein
LRLVWAEGENPAKTRDFLDITPSFRDA